MESKLLVGGKNIVDHTNEQQRILELKRQEIAEQVQFPITHRIGIEEDCVSVLKMRQDILVSLSCVMWIFWEAEF